LSSSSRLLPALLLSLSMCVASTLAVRLKVPDALSNSSQLPGLALMIPAEFGEWRMLATPVNAIVNPVVDEVLARTYTEVVNRVYSDSRGGRVMLSVAYGSNQSRDLQVHRPEVCYSAQGFSVSGLRKGVVVTDHGSLPVMRLTARAGARTEPITYWLRMGDTVVRGNVEQGLARVAAGLRGHPIDGVVVRVSSIGDSPAAEYGVHEAFVASLLSRIDQRALRQLTGSALIAPAKTARN
jgi:EpsI family protein